jgi:ABC-type transport system involved in multi-copper enzyme maturation permease subunit
VLKTGKGRPFLEIFASTLNEDYRFPILEIFAFLYTLGTFVFASFGPVTAPLQGLPGETVAYSVTSSILGTYSLLIFLILVFKNVAYGLGSDLEKGIIQTYFSYPLKRYGILTAKLLSALVIAIVLLLTIQISALYVLAPDIALQYLGIVLLTYVANLSPSLFLAGIVLLVTLILKKGGLALVFGIVLFFAMNIIGAIGMFVASSTGSPLALQILAVISPGDVLSRYYYSTELWTPTFSEVLLYVGASYAVVVFLFFLGYRYFSRRLDL